MTDMATATSTSLMTIPEEQEQWETLQRGKNKTESKPLGHPPRRLASNKICKAYVRDEMESEAAMWAYIRSSGGLRRELVVEPRFFFHRKT
ncbi:putative clathrin heavy chain [Venturia inaequalis]|nr:putative clathrin heavy chain [Venturia inaequalis]